MIPTLLPNDRESFQNQVLNTDELHEGFRKKRIENEILPFFRSPQISSIFISLDGISCNPRFRDVLILSDYINIQPSKMDRPRNVRLCKSPIL